MTDHHTDHGAEDQTMAPRPVPGAALLEVPDAPAYLVGRGLLGAAQLVDGEVSVLELARRNQNLHVRTADGGGVLLKQGATRGGGPGNVAHEARVYAALAAQPWTRLLEGRIPRCLGFDAARNLLAVELVPAEENLRELHARTGTTDAALAATIGETLGRLHRAGPAGADLPDDLPEVFATVLPRLTMLHGTSTGMQDMVVALQNLGGLADGLAELQRDWRRETVVHGDPRWDNWVVRNDTAVHVDDPPLVLVDWEFGTLGEPGWDVGSVLGDYLAAWVLFTPELPGVRLAEGVSLSRFPIEAMRPAVAALWEAYLGARRPADPAAELTMAVRCAAAKLVQLCGERMHHSTALTATAAALLQLADHVFGDPARAASDLLGLAVPVDWSGAA